MTVSAFDGVAPVYFFYTWYVAGFGKNALTGDGCCWHAQHGVCHRTKNQITGLTFCSPTYGTRWAAYRRLSHVLMIKLQLHRVSLSRHHVGRSHNASRVELCSNRQLWRFCRITWRSGRESMSHRSMSSSMTATMEGNDSPAATPCNSTASSKPSIWAKFDSASVATLADVMVRQTDCATGVRSVRGSGADRPLILSHVTVASLLGR